MNMQRSISINSNSSPPILENSTSSLNFTTPIATQPIPKKSQQIRTDKPRPHVCAVCTRAFARLEHLKRHERAHTNEKPYQCAACGRCFARRDLVLRHQQKLHTNLPNIMRRGSSKDQDINEHINVLHNNTDANAPLPNGVMPIPDEPIVKNSSSKNTTPQFRTALFGSVGEKQEENSTQSPQPQPQPTMGVSPITSSNSPRPSITLHSSTHRNSVSFNQPKAIPMSRQNSVKMSRRKSSQHQIKQELSPESDSPRRKKSLIQNNSNANSTPLEFSTIPSHLLNNYRHASYSAASGISYTTIKDAIQIQENNINFTDSAPTHVEFGTPPLGPQSEDYHKIMGMTDLMDWGNIDTLDLGEDDKNALRQKSLKNLHDFFTDGLKKVNNLSNNDIQQRNGSVSMQQTQSMPQHRNTIFEIEDSLDNQAFSNNLQQNSGIPPPPSINQIQPQPAKQNLSPQSNQGSISSAGSIDPQQLSNKMINSNKRSRSSMENGGTPQGSSVNGTSNDSSDWIKDLVGQSLDMNLNFSANTSFDDLKGYFQNSKSIESKGNFPKKQAQDFMQQLLAGSNPNNGAINLDTNINYSIEFPANFYSNESSLIVHETRQKMLEMSNMNDNEFPSLENLKYYTQLYEFGFNKYFSFIHLPSLKSLRGQNFEIIPLLSAIAAIGSLYSYNNHDALLLFNLSKFQIQNFFEKELTADNLQFKKIPLMAHQCLVLHIMISLFFNEPNMIDITSRQIKSMIRLIQSTHFNEPLEHTIIPPPQVPQGITTDETKQIIQHNYDYFIMAQSRIRTLHLFYILQIFRSSMTGQPILFSSNQLKNGSSCIDDKLWWSSSATSWYATVCKTNPPNWSIIELSNGQSVDSFTNYLTNPYLAPHIPIKNLLIFLLNIHEQLENEQNQMNFINWNLEKRSKFEKMINSWEILFNKNYGSLYITTENRNEMIRTPDLKLIIPLYNMLKLKFHINYNSIITYMLQKNYNLMNKELDLMDYKESNYNVLSKNISSCCEILKVWIHTTEIISFDVRETAVRTPVFLCCTIFISILILATYLDFIEQQCNRRDVSNQELLDWFKCSKILIRIDKILNTSVKSVYSDVLTKDMNDLQNFQITEESIKKLKSFSEERSIYDDNIAKNLNLEFNKNQVIKLNKEINNLILNFNLSRRYFYIGIRILADAPVWPASMGFAEALQFRASYLNQRGTTY
ncbi:uncharacterized protein KGF55_003259 [Candida pseudojiufengensis]|uniref:uncharacterized protein n=1 Tax=Candida pseudojiufengensis TaxID=497109 RepID=UPI00222474E6|nr:uncharacterized protein KGF55_003259 [Candida pseudojiufengensis]KAI5962183.1 hypothetical protein KGF55_003259 [Candida pseudojiufengensis]